MKFLQMDSPFIRFLSTMADLMILNLLTIICCIPVVTAGASFTAMHYVLTKMVRNEEGYIVKSFFHAFKQNLLQGIFIWIGMIGVGALLCADWLLILSSKNALSSYFLILLYGVAIILVLAALYVFPVLSRYHNTIRGTIKMAFTLMVVGMGYLRTIANAMLFLLPVAFMWFWQWDATPFLVVFCFSLPGYFRAALYNGLFKKFETSSEEAPQQDEEEKEKNDKESI